LAFSTYLESYLIYNILALSSALSMFRGDFSSSFLNYSISTLILAFSALNLAH
jgi:hypothetical protein